MKKQHAKWVAWGYVVWLVLAHPIRAAHTTHGIASGLGQAAESLSEFIQDL